VQLAVSVPVAVAAQHSSSLLLALALVLASVAVSVVTFAALGLDAAHRRLLAHTIAVALGVRHR
jgi:hypothetical protein